MTHPNPPIGELNHFIFTTCYDRLCDGITQKLNQPVIGVDYHHQRLLQLDEDCVYYTFVAGVDYSEDDGAVVQVSCQIRFGAEGYDFTVTNAQLKDGAPAPAMVGVGSDQNLIPRLYNDDLREAEATRFLRRYCPAALLTPMPVPIRTIMEEQMGLKIVTDMRLLDDAFAQTMFEHREELVGDELLTDIMVEDYDRGTVLVDGDMYFEYGIGRMNLALAHEAYHWFAHRPYVDFHRLIGKQKGESYNGISQYSAADILEIQASAVASRILMPKDMFIQKYHECENEDIHETISALADFFAVSYAMVAIRLRQLGLRKIPRITSTTKVTRTEAAELYFRDEQFRALVDDEKIIYVDDRYVINDPRYVELVWEDVPKRNAEPGPFRLTDYALQHQEEAFVTFTIDHQRVIDAGDGILQYRSDEHLRMAVEELRIYDPKESARMKAHADHFEKLFAKAEKKTFCGIAKEMIDYRYGRMEDFDPEHRIDPTSLMPETGKKYFNDDDSDTEHRFYDNLAPRTYRDDRTIFDEASSPIDLFCADTAQLRQYYEKIMKGTAGQPDNATLMSLCVGLCLSPKAATVLFQAAGRTLSWERTDMAYKYILHQLRGEYIEDVNNFLLYLGLDPLGAKRNVTG